MRVNFLKQLKLKAEIYYFCAVKMREQISSWIMLSVFVPMLLISSFHIHVESNEVIDCDECAGLVHHSGHITSHVSSIDDCVLCRFLSLTYNGSKIQQVRADADDVVAILTDLVWQQPSQEATTIISLRAPPRIL